MSSHIAAVFGLSDSTEGPPAWIADDAAVARRLNAKRADDIGPEIWWEVAEIARLCRTLSRWPWRDRSPVTPLRAALRHAMRTAGALPPAPPPYVAPPSIAPAPAEELRMVGPRVHLLDVASQPLGRAVDDQLWTDPVALAGYVDDVLTALTCVAADVVALAGPNWGLPDAGTAQATG